jgi:hypothetical protein
MIAIVGNDQIASRLRGLLNLKLSRISPDDREK